EDAMRREEPEHPVQRVGVETGPLGEHSARGAFLVERIRDAELRDHMQAACRDMAVREVDERLNGVAHGGGERLAGYELDAASAVLIASLARLDRDAVRRIAIVRVDVVVAAAKRHDPRGPSDERARVLEFLRDDKGVRVREA